MLSESFSGKRGKILGAVLVATALVVLGVAVMGQNDQTNLLERSAAITAKYANADVPLANLPDESEVQTPEGWDMLSDEPVEGPEEEEAPENENESSQEEVAEDDDIDSPLDVEEDEHGDKYVAEMGDDVIVTEDAEEKKADNAVVAEDRRYPRCYKNLRKCGYRKACTRKCKKLCVSKARRVCKSKKFCKCFCKYYKSVIRAKKCVYYKRRLCYKVKVYKCKRGCKKYCKRVPRCYCCARVHVRQACRKLCKRISYKTKCGKCRCYRIKCYKYCKFVCKKYRKY